MAFNFPLILVNLTLISGLIVLIDVLWWAPKRRAMAEDLPVVIDYARSFFPVLLIVLVVRSFIVQPFEVPSGSLEPTVVPGDFLMVNQFSYGLHLPVWGTKILSVGEPKRGDIAVFEWPVNPAVDYIKRIIGVPGDVISYQNKVLTINGQVMKQSNPRVGQDSYGIPVIQETEDLGGVVHNIYINPSLPAHDFYNVRVPPGEYFVMGDNRNNSEDSRYWGFVPAANLIGKAEFIVFSWNANAGLFHKVRWGRLGMGL